MDAPWTKYSIAELRNILKENGVVMNARTKEALYEKIVASKIPLPGDEPAPIPSPPPRPFLRTHPRVESEDIEGNATPNFAPVAPPPVKENAPPAGALIRTKPPAAVEKVAPPVTVVDTEDEPAPTASRSRGRPRKQVDEAALELKLASPPRPRGRPPRASVVPGQVPVATTEQPAVSAAPAPAPARVASPSPVHAEKTAENPKRGRGSSPSPTRAHDAQPVATRSPGASPSRGRKVAGRKSIVSAVVEAVQSAASTAATAASSAASSASTAATNVAQAAAAALTPKKAKSPARRRSKSPARSKSPSRGRPRSKSPARGRSKQQHATAKSAPVSPAVRSKSPARKPEPKTPIPVRSSSPGRAKSTEKAVDKTPAKTPARVDKPVAKQTPDQPKAAAQKTPVRASSSRGSEDTVVPAKKGPTTPARASHSFNRPAKGVQAASDSDNESESESESENESEGDADVVSAKKSTTPAKKTVHSARKERVPTPIRSKPAARVPHAPALKIETGSASSDEDPHHKHSAITHDHNTRASEAARAALADDTDSESDGEEHPYAEHPHKMTLLTAPLTTLRALAKAGLSFGRRLIRRVDLTNPHVALSVALAFLLVVAYTTPETIRFPKHHHETLKDYVNEGIYYLWWVWLGILSSIGFGSGLHTFVLYLAPYIVQVTLTAYECSTTTDFKHRRQNIGCRVLFGEHQDTTTFSFFFAVIGLVRWEAFAWGVGTAIGELPPYFFARAARQSGRMDDELEEELAQMNDLSDQTLFTRGKRFVHYLVQTVGFWGILVCASVPNPLFDLAGITCGHFLVPFGVFFGATLIGKAIIKPLIQTVFVVACASPFVRPKLTDFLTTILPASLSSKLNESVAKVSRSVHTSGNDPSAVPEGSLVASAWELFILLMIGYFAYTMFNGVAQGYVRRRAAARQKRRDAAAAATR